MHIWYQLHNSNYILLLADIEVHKPNRKTSIGNMREYRKCKNLYPAEVTGVQSPCKLKKTTNPKYQDYGIISSILRSILKKSGKVQAW